MGHCLYASEYGRRAHQTALHRSRKKSNSYSPIAAAIRERKSPVVTISTTRLKSFVTGIYACSNHRFWIPDKVGFQCYLVVFFDDLEFLSRFNALIFIPREIMPTPKFNHPEYTRAATGDVLAGSEIAEPAMLGGLLEALGYPYQLVSGNSFYRIFLTAG